jgi:dienelactone hydrolase
MTVSFRTLPLAGLLMSLALAVTAGAEPEIVQFETEDGVVINARFFAPEANLRTAVIYVHQPGRSSADWEYIGAKLAEIGVAGLAPDLRGHGESCATAGGEEINRELFGADDFNDMVLDVSAAVDYLRDERALGTSGIQVVGADVGGSAALLYSVEDPDIEALALLSPGLMYDGVDAVGQVSAYGQRPLLMVVSVEDGYSVKSADVLGREATGFFHLETYYGVGHGTKMLNREPKLEPLITSWVLGTFETPGGASLAERKLLEQQDRRAGDDMLDELAAEERARAEQDRDQVDANEDSEQSAETDEEDRPRRWD